MCAICGCNGAATASALEPGTGERHDFHEHVHADGTRHSHPPALHHDDGQGHLATHLDLESRILARNDELAARNAAWLARRGVFALNLMGAPGSGKTTLLERTIGAMDRGSIVVIEGDQATANDAERVGAAGAAVVQVNTGTGCHLDATMVARGLDELDPAPGCVAVIENVGNLVCPALFRLGEGARAVVLSAAEGDDKPLKYPHMFRAADIVLINKVDLLPYVDFDVERASANVRALNPDARVMRVSARTGEGLQAWIAWLLERAAALSPSASPHRAVHPAST